MFSDSQSISEFQEEQKSLKLNFQQIDFNYLLFQGLRYYEERNMQKAIVNFEKLLKKKGLNAQTKALMLGNLGVLYFYKFDHKAATERLESALGIVQKTKEILKTPGGRSLALKLLANMCIISIATNNFKNAKSFNNRALNLIQNEPNLKNKSQLMEEL